MFDFIREIFSFPFMLRAFAVGIPVALCSSLLGVPLVLKQYSMIGDGLSHVAFGALAVATVMNFAPLEFAVPVVIIAAFFLLRITDSGKLRGDAAIGLISAGSLAIGVTAISLKSGVNTDVYNYLFGSILSMTDKDVYMSLILSAVVLFLFIFMYSKIFAVSFDETFAKATGTKSGLYKLVISVLTAITIVLGMRMIGSMLISALIIIPPLSAMRVCGNFRSVIIVAAVVSVFSLISGITASYSFSTPAGASIVLVNIAVFIVFFAVDKLRSLKCFSHKHKT